MRHSTGKPTAAQQARFTAIKLDVGCVVCRLQGVGYRPPDIHHLTSCGRRIGHDASIGLCLWHHRGIPDDGRTSRQMRELYGPSLTDGSKTFRDAYGDDEGLLEAANEMLGDRH